MDLSGFLNKDLFNASLEFFEQIGINTQALASNYTQSLSLENILGSYFKHDKWIFKQVKDTYFLGLLNEQVFQGEDIGNPNFQEMQQQFEEDYEGLAFFAVEMESSCDPNKADLSELVRAFNQASKELPVILLVKAGNYLSLVSCERTPYKQAWLEGEKVGKVSLLRSIDIQEPHSGHLLILNKLRFPTSGKRGIQSFTDLYYHWQAVLSISVLNKQFYNEIVDWFNWAVEEIKIPGQDTASEKHRDFAIRLSARLIFVWFLKELRVVSEDLLVPKWSDRKSNDLIIPKQSGSYYYKFILQNLFFNALNRQAQDREKRLYHYYREFFDDPDEIEKLIDQSPYLNGGLFDASENDYYDDKVPNNGLVVPDELFIGDRGLNSILSGYKFTISENTPQEEEIAVDPEMLGRIFENLLAEQNEDTRDSARNNKGAFYTPRPVVAYMCQNTLQKHLGEDINKGDKKTLVKKLLNTKVLDPACGSGAFLMGMLDEMMNVLEVIDPKGHRWTAELLRSNDEAFKEHISGFIEDDQVRYVKKLGLLKNCLFGSDILEYGVEITKLRCWLSLIVEQRVDLQAENYNLKPLPNLEFKFFQKNSLLRKYGNRDLNDWIRDLDKNNLLEGLVELENNYFITSSNQNETKETIRQRIVDLLKKPLDEQEKKVRTHYNSALKRRNTYQSKHYPKKEVNKAQREVDKYAKELAELADFRKTINDYLIESVFFPGIFNNENDKDGFDIVISNPPYVNTKLIAKQGMTNTLRQEYGFCDDLYNHFTFRGLELLKSGGYLSYITSDTFLTILSKTNMRKIFLGLDPSMRSYMIDQEGFNQFTNCRLTEIVNTPKAFQAMVDTAVFTIKKEVPQSDAKVTYTDLRFPTAQTFGLTQEQWEKTTKATENYAGWEKVLDKAFSELGQDAIKEIDWVPSHNCDESLVYIDRKSKLSKYLTDLYLFRSSLNYSIFPPTEYNSELFEKIIKPYWQIFSEWWSYVSTSDSIVKNKTSIDKKIKVLKPQELMVCGLLTDGGQGLATGDNGTFLAVRPDSNEVTSIKKKRPEKLYKAITKNKEIKKEFKLLSDVEDENDCKELLDRLDELEIRKLFDKLKAKFGLKTLGRGFIYRIASSEEIKAIEDMTKNEKAHGINSDTETFVRYDKGDKGGYKWLTETPYLINWSYEAVQFLQTWDGARFQGERFFFKPGFSWNIINGTRNTNDLKFKFIKPSVNDVGGMKLTYDKKLNGYISNKYLVCLFNSYLYNRLSESFINFTVNFQMNDARQLPVKVPTQEQLAAFEDRFDQCYAIQEKHFRGELSQQQAQEQLAPIEAEIDQLVNDLYGMGVKEESALKGAEQLEAASDE